MTATFSKTAILFLLGWFLVDASITTRDVAAQAPTTKTPANNRPLPKNPLTAGRFGKAWDARVGGLHVVCGPEQHEPPLTIDLWVKAFSKEAFNIFIASEAKSSPTHWELYSYAKTGELSFFMPGRGGEFKSNVNVCDGEWHHVAAAFEPERLRLMVDGKLALDKPVRKQEARVKTSLLSFGQLVEGGIGCQALLDEVRITSGVVLFDEPPTKAPEGGRGSLGIWRFDSFDGKVKDESKALNPAEWNLTARVDVIASSKTPATGNRPGHYSEEVVGFQWKEQDSVSDRWQKTDIGPFLASVVGLPSGPVRKGLSIKLGEKNEATVCYDTEHATLRGWWTSGFLRFGPQRFGLIEMPKPSGTLRYAIAEGKAWKDVAVRHEALTSHGGRVVLETSVGSSRVFESPWIETNGGVTAVTRTFVVERKPQAESQAVQVTVLESAGEKMVEQNIGGQTVWTIYSGEQRLSAFVIGEKGLRLLGLDGEKQKQIALSIPAEVTAKPFKLVTSVYHSEQQGDWEAIVKNSPAAEDIAPLRTAGPRHWPTDLTTQGVVGNSDGPLAVDNLTLPFDNPYQAQFFASGHGFFSNGDMALCTVHGDVWRVSGVDDKLTKLTWKRYATGLFQPLGLAVVEDHVYVLGRDQITRLIDLNHDGEADRYENFNNQHHTSAGGHDYVTGLDTDSAGNFFFVHATQGAIRVSRDGQQFEVIATGLRNPNGSGVGGSDIMTAAPQEGNWTPASSIFEVNPGNHFGFGGPKVTESRPLGYDPPLCWIPRRRDNSSGGQVWIPTGVWGPLSGQMIHLSYGQCRAMLVLRETLGGVVQGGTCELPLPAFDSGVMRGKFNTADGHLYLSGLRGWSNAAAQDGCLQRVRYTGKPLDLPVAAKSLANGIKLTFSRPLDRETAEDVDNFFLEQWNYHYRSEYGSPDYKVSEPNKEGRDEVAVKSATLLPDGKSVFLEIPELKPVMQMAIGYRLRAADQAPIRHTIYYTINAVNREAVPEGELHRRPRTSLLSEAEQARLRPGLLARFRQDSGDGFLDDARVERLPALNVSAAKVPTPFLAVKPFRVTYEGYVRVPLAESYRFRVAAKGIVKCLLNGKEILAYNSSQADSTARSEPVELKGGFNRLELKYETIPLVDAELKLYWSSESFAEEPLPPTVLMHRSDDPQLLRSAELRRGREVFTELQCQRCHAGVFDKVSGSEIAMPELGHRPPDLKRVGELSDAWLITWLQNPAAVRADAHMPRLFALDDEGAKQAADVAAYLRSLVAKPQKDPLTKPVTDSPTMIAAGEVLFEQLSCLACHRFSEPNEKDPHERRSLQYAATRFADFTALSDFVRQPHAHQPAIRMPDFQLSVAESQQLAAFIRSQVKGKLPPSPDLAKANPERGRELFIAKGCQNCHELEQKPLADPRRLSMKGKIITRACLAEQLPANATWPLFTIPTSDREALIAFVNFDLPALTRDPPQETSQRLFGALRCASCHDRDQDRSPRGKLLIEEGNSGVAPEVLPNLTWAGEKLRTDWLSEFLTKPTPAARTWLKSRMPRFPAYGAHLAAGFAAEHGVAARGDSFTSLPERVTLGKQLLEPNALDCRQCHGVGKEPPRADKQTLLAPGINFALVRERVRHDYFQRFLLDPPRYDIGSRMPKLAADGKKTKVEAIHNGDAREQFESIWHWLQSGDIK